MNPAEPLASLLDTLNDEQRRAITSNAAPLCILAGAGSGKTRVLTYRIAYRAQVRNLDPSHTLAITFTRKAADELTNRLSVLGLSQMLHSGTFHSIAYSQLRSLWADHDRRPPTVLDNPASFINRLLPTGFPGSTDFGDAIDASREIEWAKARMVPPSDYAIRAAEARRSPQMGLASIAEIFELYENEKFKRGFVDMADLLDQYRHALLNNDTFRASQQWRFRHLFVDEFQDVNPAQFALLEALRGDRSDLCVVGDPNQAIFSFNGAEQALLTKLANRIGNPGTIQLNKNYRSTPQILTIAHSVLGASATNNVVPTLSSGTNPTLSSQPDDATEARFIARRISELHEIHSSWKSQAVLVRTNAQVSIIAAALTAAEIPHRIRGDLSHTDPGSTSRTSMPTKSPGSTGSKGETQTTGITPSPHGQSGDAVDISTFHASKGLEWDIVHLAGLEKGFVPISHARTPKAEAEERRLLYVAITRAKHELHMTWAQQRSFGNHAAQREPSEYLEVITKTMDALASGEVTLDSFGDLLPTTSKGDAATQRSQSDRIAKPRDPRRSTANHRPHRNSPITQPSTDRQTRDLFEALRTWRSTRARAARVPAYVIFHDATLMEVAAKAPKCTDELMAIPGIGPVKIERFGNEILRVVAESK